MRRGSLRAWVRASGILTVALIVAGDAQPVFAQWLVVPFVGATAGAKTGYFNPDRAVEQKKPMVGVSVSKKWKRLYIEADLTEIPGFFTGNAEDRVITSSNVLLFSGSLIATLPTLGRVTPYGVAGLGAQHVRIRDEADVFPVSTWQPALTVGGGVLLRVRPRIQVRADVRYAISRRDEGVASSIGFGTNYLDFWRPSVGVGVAF